MLDVEGEGLLLIVFEAQSGAAVHALLFIEFARRGIPHVAQVVDEELIGLAVFLHHNLAFFRGAADGHICHAGLAHDVLKSLFVLVGHLYHHAGIFGEECVDEVARAEAVEVDVETALCVGETHLQEAGDEAAGGDVVTGEHKAFLHELLHGVERIAEIFGVSHGGRGGAQVAEALGESGAAESLAVVGEVDVIERGSHAAGIDHRTNDAAHVAHLAARAHDDRARRHHLRAVGIFLRHGERVFARRHIYFKGDTEIRQGLHAGIEACVLALLRTAGPHPVGGEAHAVEPFCQRRPHEVGKALCHGQHGTCGGVDKPCLRGMANGGGNAAAAAIVKGHCAAVCQGQLQFALRLLERHLARHAAVHLIREPVLAGHGFEAKHVVDVFV